LDTVVGLWEWKIPARVHSHHCCSGGSDAWSEVPSEPHPVSPPKEPVARFQEGSPSDQGAQTAVGSRACHGQDAPHVVLEKSK